MFITCGKQLFHFIISDMLSKQWESYSPDSITIPMKRDIVLTEQHLEMCHERVIDRGIIQGVLSRLREHQRSRLYNQIWITYLAEQPRLPYLIIEVLCQVLAGTCPGDNAEHE